MLAMETMAVGEGRDDAVVAQGFRSSRWYRGRGMSPHGVLRSKSFCLAKSSRGCWVRVTRLSGRHGRELVEEGKKGRALGRLDLMSTKVQYCMTTLF